MNGLRQRCQTCRGIWQGYLKAKARPGTTEIGWTNAEIWPMLSGVFLTKLVEDTAND